MKLDNVRDGVLYIPKGYKAGEPTPLVVMFHGAGGSGLGTSYCVPLADEFNFIVLAPDSTIPALTDGGRTLALAGVPAQWAFPAADTLAGMKYAAHRFAARVVACRTR